MVTFDCSASRYDGVTLVTVRLRAVAVPTRVTVRNRLDGPVWPPRREGVPEAGWTETGFSGVVGPGSHALGYATPARPDGPPAELTDAVAVPETEPVGDRCDRPADVVRELGDPSPPGDAVPVAGPPASHSARATSADADTGSPEATDSGESPKPIPSDSGDGGAPSDRVVAPRECDRAADQPAKLPPAVGPWLAEMARRVDRAEALADADTVPEATTAVRAAGGLDGVRELADSEDERQLRRLARRARRLADRRAEATVPVETLTALG